MKIEEVKALVPKADVYEISNLARYLIVIDKKSINQEIARQLMLRFQGIGIPALIIAVDGDPATAMKIFEDKLEEEDAII